MRGARVETALAPLVRLARRRRLLVFVWTHHCRWGVAVIGMITTAGIILVRGDIAPTWWFVLMASLVPITAIVLAYRRLPAPRALLREIDSSLHHHDLLGAAYEFYKEGEATRDDEFARAAKSSILRDAACVAPDVPIKTVFPLRRYRVRRADLAVAFTLLAATLIPERSPAATPPQYAQPPLELRASVSPQDPRIRDLVAPLRRELASLKENEDELGAVASALDQVLEEARPDDAQLVDTLATLDELDAALALLQRVTSDEAALDAELLAAGLREIAEQLRATEEGRVISQALGELNASQVEDGLSRALRSQRPRSNEGSNADTSPGDRRLLQRMSKGIERALRRQTETAQQLEALERRLSRNSRNGARAAKDLNETERTRDELQRLKRKQRAEKKARDRLRDLRRNVRDLRRQTSQHGPSRLEDTTSADPSKAAAGEDGRMTNERALIEGLTDATDRVSRSQRTKRTRGVIKSARRTLRRLANEGGRSRSVEAHTAAFVRAARGGRLSSPAAVQEPNGVIVLDANKNAHSSADPVTTDGPEKSADGGSARGGMTSTGAAPRVFNNNTGAPPPKDSGRQTSQPLAGTSGPGSSRALTIRDATQRGFANAAYDDVFTDYRGLAQSALDDETIPAAQRDVARRYFRMIQPRK